MTRVRDLDFFRIDFRFGAERLIAHNTYAGIGEVTEHGFDPAPIGHPLPQPDDGRHCFAYVRFHRTIIVRRTGRDTFVLDSGGWRTSTTKQRINALLGPAVNVHQKDFAWYVTDLDGTRPFTDGMEVRTP